MCGVYACGVCACGVCASGVLCERCALSLSICGTNERIALSEPVVQRDSRNGVFSTAHCYLLRPACFARLALPTCRILVNNATGRFL